MSTDGLVYDRPSFTWVTPEEKARRDADREERWFQRQLSQGQLAAPAVISDTMPAVKSMHDGRMYDSKSRLRRTYRDAGLTEVGNDSSTTAEYIDNYRQPKDRPKSRAEKDARFASVRHSMEKAFSQANLTSYRKDEIN